nr:hypothetical protein [Ornithinibacillus scapharcae]
MTLIRKRYLLTTIKKDNAGKWNLSPQLKTSTSYRTIDIDDDTIDSKGT